MNGFVRLDMSLCCDVELGVLIGGDDSVRCEWRRRRSQDIGEKRAIHAMRKWLSGLRVMVKRVNIRRRAKEEDGRTLNYKAEQFGHTSHPKLCTSGQGQGRLAHRTTLSPALYDPLQALQHSQRIQQMRKLSTATNSRFVIPDCQAKGKRASRARVERGPEANLYVVVLAGYWLTRKRKCFIRSTPHSRLEGWKLQESLTMRLELHIQA
jgi:hypothetical protein